MLHHTLDARAVLAEAVRMLRPGGLLLGYDLADTPPQHGFTSWKAPPTGWSAQASCAEFSKPCLCARCACGLDYPAWPSASAAGNGDPSPAPG